MINNEEYCVEKARKLRAVLHNCPEPAGKEVQTLKCLYQFLKDNTSLELHEEKGWLYAVHREETAAEHTLQTLVFRADIDALPKADGTFSHMCGHDGHAAVLGGFALWLEGKVVGKNIVLLFQPAEETGEGAKLCLELFEKEKMTAVFGMHNLPGMALGKVFVREGTFACASFGMTLHFEGKNAHAAYPEFGLSPAAAVGKLLCDLPALSYPKRYAGLTRCTVVGLQMGEKAFGTAAASANLWLTLRGEMEASLHLLEENILLAAEQYAKQDGLLFSVEKQDVFPATVNTKEETEYVQSVCDGSVLEEPMRWSEDFGWYLTKKRGAFFGIGAGEAYPALHTDEYTFPDELIPYALHAWISICEG